MKPRLYDRARDRDALLRIWRETGWLQEYGEHFVDVHVDASRTLVSEIRGAPECAVSTMPGALRHLGADVPMSCVTAVQTSRIARRKGLALRLTARALALDVADGAVVSTLGMFEQGFYNRAGFGTGTYVHHVGFDPAGLPSERLTRSPVRLSSDDYQRVHANRIAGSRPHGALSIEPAGFTHAEMIAGEREHAFGLGFAESPGGPLTHHLWINPKGEVEFGPYHVEWAAWSTRHQFRELISVLRNFGDQVPIVYMRETHDIQLQDLADKPITRRRVTEGTKFDAQMRALADWQLRVNDIEQCMAHTQLPGRETMRFNLRVADPIERYLDEGEPWRGAGGEFIITLGPQCHARRGADASLPTLKASINAFSRLWLGVRPAGALAITDALEGPNELIETLDWILCLPTPDCDWVF